MESWNEQETSPSWNQTPWESTPWTGVPWSGVPYDPNAQWQQPYAPAPQAQQYPPQEQPYSPPQEQYTYPQQYDDPPQPQAPPPRTFWDELRDLEALGLDDVYWEDLEEEEEAPEQKRTARRVLSIIANVVFFGCCITLITAAVAFMLSNSPDKAFFGYRVYNVVSESMTPTQQLDGSQLKGGFYKGDAIIVKLALPEGVQPGDIITVWTSADKTGTPLTHRCMEVLMDYNGDAQLYFRTKGDANQAYDNDPTPGNRLIGIKVATLPHLGEVLNFAQEHKLLTACLCVGTMALIFLGFVLLSRKPGPPARKKKTSDEPDKTGEPDETYEPDEPLPAPAYACAAPAWQEPQGDYDRSWQWYQEMNP